MEISLSTPALLFPAISLLLLAFTNRFLTLATIIRGLHDRYLDHPHENLVSQIANLRYRIYLIRNMQIFGVASLLLCTFSMFALVHRLDNHRSMGIRRCPDINDDLACNLHQGASDLSWRVGFTA